MVNCQNMGVVAGYLNRLVTNSAYTYLQEKTGQFMEWLVEKQGHKLVHKAEVGLKSFVPWRALRRFGHSLFLATRWTRHSPPH